MKSKLWTIPRIWPDSTVYIIGGGPSILTQDLTVLASKRVIGVNMAFLLGPWVDIIWYGDKQWYNLQSPRILSYNGLVLTCSAEAQNVRRHPAVKYVGRSKPSGIESKKRTHVAWNGCSGASAISVAYWLGAKKVILLGFDMQIDAKNKAAKTHWHDEYPLRWDKKKSSHVNPYPKFLLYWPQIMRDAKRLGLEILNATPNSALNLFPKVTLESTL